jgi:hypothetical protein
VGCENAQGGNKTWWWRSRKHIIFNDRTRRTEIAKGSKQSKCRRYCLDPSLPPFPPSLTHPAAHCCPSGLPCAEPTYCPPNPLSPKILEYLQPTPPHLSFTPPSPPRQLLVLLIIPSIPSYLSPRFISAPLLLLFLATLFLHFFSSYYLLSTCCIFFGQSFATLSTHICISCRPCRIANCSDPIFALFIQPNYSLNSVGTCPWFTLITPKERKSLQFGLWLTVCCCRTPPSCCPPYSWSRLCPTALPTSLLIRPTPNSKHGLQYFSFRLSASSIRHRS